MKKFTKIGLIICLVLVGTGLIACIAGISLGFRYGDFRDLARNGAFNIGSFGFGWIGDNDNQSGDAGDWTEQVYTFDANEIETIDIEFEFGEVNIEPSDSEQIEVTTNYRSIWNTFTRHINCEVEGRTLSIDDDVDGKLLKLRPWNSYGETAYLTIRLPKSKYYKEFKLETSACAVYLNTEIKGDNISLMVGAGEMTGGSDGYLNAEKELKLETGAGAMELSNIVAGDLKVDCGIGETILDNVKARNTRVDCGIGSVTMSMAGRKADYSYDVESSIGDVEIGGSSFSGLTSRGIKTDGANHMEIQCGIGTVSISFQEQE